MSLIDKINTYLDEAKNNTEELKAYAEWCKVNKLKKNDPETLKKYKESKKE